MTRYLFFIEDYLRGKPVFSIISRMLNILFSISISSFFFEKFYFKYFWLDITDYKTILDFFIKGYFFVPFSIFIVVHFSIESISNVIFGSVTDNNSSKLAKGLIEFFGDWPSLIKWYKRIEKSESPTHWRKFKKKFLMQKRVIRERFNLAFKAIIVMTIYFFTISYFGWILYILVMMALIIILISLWGAFLFLDALPSVLRSFREKAEIVAVE